MPVRIRVRICGRIMFSLENPGIVFLRSEIGSGSISDSCTFDKFERVRVWIRIQISGTYGELDSGSIFLISESDSDFNYYILQKFMNM